MVENRLLICMGMDQGPVKTPLGWLNVEPLHEPRARGRRNCSLDYMVQMPLHRERHGTIHDQSHNSIEHTQLKAFDITVHRPRKIGLRFCKNACTPSA